MVKIIGLIGKTGSGKDTFSDYLKENFHSIDVFRFSQPLTDALSIFFDKIKKQDQIWLSNNLRNRFGEDILSRAIAKKIKESKKQLIILNGIRVIQDFNLIKELNGKTVYISVDIEKRWRRVQLRKEKEDDNVDFDKFTEMDNNRTEEQIKDLGEKADFIIENNNDLQSFKNNINNLINEILNE